MDEDEVGEEQHAEDEVEVESSGGEPRQKQGEGERGGEDAGAEGAAVVVVEEMAGFEVCDGRVEVVERMGFQGTVIERAGVEETGVEEAVGGVEGPDGGGHREGRGERQADVVGGGEEPGPERGDGGGVEREEMPEGDGVRAGEAPGVGWCGVCGLG
jgi:hypothetical protein